MVVRTWFGRTGHIRFVTAITTVHKTVAPADQWNTLAIVAGELLVVADQGTALRFIAPIRTISIIVAGGDAASIFCTRSRTISAGTYTVASFGTLAAFLLDLDTIASQDSTESDIECVLVRAFDHRCALTLSSHLNSRTARRACTVIGVSINTAHRLKHRRTFANGAAAVVADLADRAFRVFCTNRLRTINFICTVLAIIPTVTDQLWVHAAAIATFNLTVQTSNTWALEFIAAILAVRLTIATPNRRNTCTISTRKLVISTTNRLTLELILAAGTLGLLVAPWHTNP